MSSKLCFYVTGLPAAGKSTIGKFLSESLSISLLDKDDYLEALFETRGVGDASWRQRLSQEADVLFRKEAEAKSRIVLVSHWRPKNLDTDSGTPCNWLSDTFDTVIEIYCSCSVDIALKRFHSRNRHPGHVDRSRTIAQIGDWLTEYATHLPIGVGKSYRVNSEKIHLEIYPE